MSMTTPLRILISGPLDDRIGGMNTYCHEYLRTGLPRLFNVTHCRSILIPGFLNRHGVVRLLLRVTNSVAVLIVWISMLFAKRPDVVHVHANSYGGFYVKGLLALLGRGVGAASVLHLHGGEFREFYAACAPWQKRIIRFLFNASSATIVLSSQWRDFLVGIGVAPERVVVMANSVFVPDYEARRNTRQKLVVLFMGRFDARKGIYEMVRVLESHPDLRDSCEFILAGPRTDDWTPVAARTSTLGMGDALSLPGPLLGSEKDEAFRRADVFVLQSFFEGMPITLLEAMSYGLACITTPVGGIPEVVTDGSNGLLIPPGDADALALALRHLRDNPDDRVRLQSAARATIERNFDWDVRWREIAELYQQLSKGKVELTGNAAVSS